MNINPYIMSDSFFMGKDYIPQNYILFPIIQSLRNKKIIGAQSPRQLHPATMVDPVMI